MSYEKRFSRDGNKGGQRRGGAGAQKQGKHSNQQEMQDADYDTNSPIIQSFLTYQTELDAKHDKHERLVKCSRDVTIESKRIIFLLHRIKREEDKESTLEEAEKRLKELQSGLLKKIALELINEGPYQFSRAYTAGIQEFVEAITFYFYEKEKNLPSLQKITDEVTTTIFENDTSNDEESNILRHQVIQLIQPTDYILGIADLTGELMRKCINAIGSVDQVKMPFELCAFLRNIYDGFVAVGNQGPREISRKLNTLKQSLAKVETACYTIQVRGSEIPKHMLADVFSRDNRDYTRDEIESMYD